MNIPGNLLLAYLKGSGLSTTVTLLMLIFYIVSLGEISDFELLAAVLVFHTYIGSLAGMFLLRFLRPLENGIVYPILGIIIFGTVGLLYGLFIIYTYNLEGYFIGVTMASSISFFCSQVVKSKGASYLLAALGPLFLLLIFLSVQFIGTLGS